MIKIAWNFNYVCIQPIQITCKYSNYLILTSFEGVIAKKINVYGVQTSVTK